MGCQWIQAIVLAGGAGKKFGVITSDDRPKSLLPVGNRPLISYPLRMLESAGFQDVIVVTSGEEVYKHVNKFVESYAGKLSIKVYSTPEATGSADAVRAVADKITYDNFMVVSGDLISDVSIASLVTNHCSNDAMVTSVLKPIKNLTDPETGKPSKPQDYFGLSSDGKRLLFATSASSIGRQLKLRRSVLRLDDQGVTIRTDLRDSHLYLFSRHALEILDRHPNMHSVKEHLVPYLVTRQVASLRMAKSEGTPDEAPPTNEEGKNPPTPSGSQMDGEDKLVDDKMARFATASVSKTSQCYVHILPNETYGQRVNSLADYGDANREVATAGEAAHLSGYTMSKFDNFVDPTVVIGTRSTIGAACIVAEKCVLGDKCSVKRTVLGRNCRLGNNVKVVNSVIGDNVQLEDGANVQGSIVCSNAMLEERCQVRDCQVAPGFTVAAKMEYRSEKLEQ